MVKPITILAATTIGHELTKKAIETTSHVLNCSSILIVSDKNFFPGAYYIPISSEFTRQDYNKFMLTSLNDLITTDYVLVVQYDGMAVNGNKWDDKFLSYDYIGAPWFWHQQGKQVGNGGFSLRSKKLLEKLSKINHELDLNEDELICHRYRSNLEKQGIKFPDVAVAHMFSHEREAGFHDTFGFHGAFNVPFYLPYEKIEEYIHFMPQRGSSGHIELILYCYMKGYHSLAETALKLGSNQVNDFEQKFVDYLVTNASRFHSVIGMFHK